STWTPTAPICGPTRPETPAGRSRTPAALYSDSGPSAARRPPSCLACPRRTRRPRSGQKPHQLTSRTRAPRNAPQPSSSPPTAGICAQCTPLTWSTTACGQQEHSPSCPPTTTAPATNSSPSAPPSHAPPCGPSWATSDLTRFVDPQPKRALLLPSEPDGDLAGLLHHADVSAIWPLDRYRFARTQPQNGAAER